MKDAQEPDLGKSIFPEVWVVRHGATDWLPQHVSQGEQDLPLNELGKSQAKKTAAFLRAKLQDKQPVIVSSSFARASETAAIIADMLRINISEETRELREFYDYSKYKTTLHLVSTSETREDFHFRVKQAMRRLVKKYRNANPLIVVAHQNVFRYLAEKYTQHKVDLQNAGIARFQYMDGGWQLTILESDVKSTILAIPLMQDLFPREQTQVAAEVFRSNKMP